MLANRVDGEVDAGDGEHRGDNAVGRGGRLPWVGRREVHCHLVDRDASDQAEVDLFITERAKVC